MSEWFNFMTVGQCDFSMWHAIKIIISIGLLGFTFTIIHSLLNFVENLKRKIGKVKND